MGQRTCLFVKCWWCPLYAMALGGPPLARQVGQAARWLALRACNNMCFVVQHVFKLLIEGPLVAAVTCNSWCHAC
jgi:hypothetical protein